MVEYYLRTWQDVELKTSCEPVKDFSQLDELIDLMYSTMVEHEGCGIAAPQIGDSRQICIAKIDKKPKVFINPVIKHAQGYIPFLETCLSFPKIIVPTVRRYRIDVNYMDKNGIEHNETFRGMNAIILQHEIDHLNGKLIIDFFRSSL